MNFVWRESRVQTHVCGFVQNCDHSVCAINVCCSALQHRVPHSVSQLWSWFFRLQSTEEYSSYSSFSVHVLVWNTKWKGQWQVCRIKTWQVCGRSLNMPNYHWQCQVMNSWLTRHGYSIKRSILWYRSGMCISIQVWDMGQICRPISLICIDPCCSLTNSQQESHGFQILPTEQVRTVSSITVTSTLQPRNDIYTKKQTCTTLWWTSIVMHYTIFTHHDWTQQTMHSIFL